VTRKPPSISARGLVVAWVAIAACLSGCAALQDFLVPPPRPSGPQDPRARGADQPEFADLVVYVGGVDGAGAAARAIALRRGRVLAVGSAAVVLPVTGPATRVVRQASGYATQGLVDGHVHLEQAALMTDAADLRAETTVAGMAKALTAAGNQGTGANDWLWGWPLHEQLYETLSLAVLDRETGDRPVFLSSRDGQHAWANSALIRRLPPDVATVALAADGKLKREDALRVWRALPAPRLERLKPLLLGVLTRLQRQGLTEVHSLGASISLYYALVALEREGRLPVRCVVYFDGLRPEGQALLRPPPPPPLPGAPAVPPEVSLLPETRLVRVAGVEFGLDGTLETATAALDAPYADLGMQVTPSWDDSQVATWIRAADRARTQIAFHAVGDAAVDQVLRVLDRIKRRDGALPVRIEHARVVTDDQLVDLDRGGVICSIQPLPGSADEPPTQLQRLGNDRMAWVNRAASLEAACPVIIGSDLGGFQEARPLAAFKFLVGQSPQSAIRAEEILPSDLARKALLAGGTAAKETGVRAGGAADLVVWSRNPFAGQVEGEPDAEPLVVVLDGTPYVLSTADRAGDMR
jgi:predicted amidohydrolase YtcJ